MLNGLPARVDPQLRSLTSETWLKAEERTAKLIACIQPNKSSEERRNKVADYVQRLIINCLRSCQVFTIGSVPFKTYLPDGGIDLTIFSDNPNLKDNWANQVQDLLENEKKNESAEFHVKDVEYIQSHSDSEVKKTIKYEVGNILVDISFNQLGALCKLCFFEEVDHLINQNHLFKRSIILVKAWCYYESRTLGAHHGLISTHALETLVLYIFHVYNNSFAGPLEVLYRFLEFFGNFDWENYCVSLHGPVSISSLPDVIAEPPRNDGEELLLSRVFLETCSSVYGVFPNRQENEGQPFVAKYFNVIDPLRINNNLGSSVSKGNFFRIRSAFVFGAKRLARLLDSRKEFVRLELDRFFSNTWDRHGSSLQPDAPRAEPLRSRLSSPDDSPVVIEYEYEYKYENENNYDPKQLVFGSMGIEDFSSHEPDQTSRSDPMGRLDTWQTMMGDSSGGAYLFKNNYDPKQLVFKSMGIEDFSGHEPAQTSGSDPMGSPDTRQPMMGDNSGGALQFKFYPTGPPIPFVAMIPFYNMPPGTGTSEATSSHYSGEESLDNTDPRQKFDQSEDLGTFDTALGEGMSDILHSDFACHWQNLQFGRVCQNRQPNSHVVYRPPVMVPPTYLQGHFPSGISVSPNTNPFTHQMSYGPRLFSVADPLQPVYQHGFYDLSRYRGGTGTYMSNPERY